MTMLDERFADLLTGFLPGVPRPIAGDVRLRDAGLDSMHSIDLLLAIEDSYGIELPTDLLTDATFETAGSLWFAVDRVLSGAGSRRDD